MPDRSCLLVREQLQKEPIVLTSAKADQTEKVYHVGEQEKQRWHVEPIQLWPERDSAAVQAPTRAARVAQVSIRGRDAEVVNDALWKERRSVKGDWGAQTTCYEREKREIGNKRIGSKTSAIESVGHMEASNTYT